MGGDDVIRDVLAFALVAGVLTITPGLDTALVIRSSLAGGRRSGRLAATGVCTGVLAWGILSAVGVSALVTASRTAFDVVRIAGAAYLLALGARSFLRPRAAGAADGDASEGDDRADVRRPRSAFRSGLLSNLLNPKVGAFYVSVLPGFIPPRAPVLATSMLLAGIHATEGIVWLTIVATLVTRIGPVMRTPRVRRALERVTGGVLVALGIRLALERR